MFKSYHVYSLATWRILGLAGVVLTTLDLHVQVLKLGTARYLSYHQDTEERDQSEQRLASSLLPGNAFGSLARLFFTREISFSLCTFHFIVTQ